MKLFRKILFKSLLSILGGALGLAILAILGLNLAKFVIYRDYFAIKKDICANPGLSDGFVCQGIAANEENGLILVSGYMKDHSPSRIYVTDLENQSHYVQLLCEGEEFTGHAGGIAVTGGNIYIASGNRVHSLPLSDVILAESGASVEIGAGTPVNNEASFIYSDDTYLYVGEFHDGGKYNIEGHENETAEGTHYAICSVYEPSDLTKPVKIYSIRDKVQGICFLPDGKVLMSTSYGLTDSVYYLYDTAAATDSGKTLDGAPLFYLDQLMDEFTGPAMSEGLDFYEGRVITLTESASNKYIFGKFFFANKIVGLEIGKRYMDTK